MVRDTGDMWAAALSAAREQRRTGRGGPKRRMDVYLPTNSEPPKSLFCLRKDNPFRKACLRLAEWKPFEYFILVMILANCFALAITTPFPNQDSNEVNAMLERLEYIFMVVFTFECGLKIIAYGFFDGPDAYLKNVWNILDFVIVTVGLVSMVLAHAQLDSNLFDVKALRAFRVLRPLRLVSGVPSLQIVLNSVLRAMIPLFHIALLTLFLIIMYAIIGLELFSGKLHETCWWNTEHPEEAVMMTDPTPCSADGYQCDDLPISYEMYESNITWSCWSKRIKYWVGPNDGITNFDNFGLAMLTVFQCVTMESWTDVMYYINDAMGADTAWLYFLTLIILGSFFVLNLVLGVLSGEYAKERGRQAKREEFQKLREENQVKETVKGYLEWLNVADKVEGIFDHELGSGDGENSEDDTAHNDSKKASRERLAKDRIEEQKSHSDLTKIANGALVKAPMSPVGGAVGAGTPGSMEALDMEDDYETTVATGEEGEDTSVFDEDELKFSQKLKRYIDSHTKIIRYHDKRIREKLTVIVKKPSFYWCVIVMVFLNTLILATEHYDQPNWLTQFQQITNIAFVVIFAMEMFVKIYALSMRVYFNSLFNRFDCIIVILSALEIIFSYTEVLPSLGMSVFRCARLLRVFKMTKQWASFSNLVNSLIASTKSIASLLLLLFLYILIFSLLGMQLFGGKFNFETSKPRQNFDSFWQSVLTVFQVLTGEQWNTVMYHGINSQGGVDSAGIFVSLYFVVLYIGGNYILLNVFLAIAVDNLNTAKTLDEEQAQAELDRLEQERLAKEGPVEEEEEDSSDYDEFEDEDLPDKKKRERKVAELGPTKKIEPIPNASSLFIFSTTNPLRVMCHKIINMGWFSNGILVCILVSSASLAMEDPINSKSTLNTILSYADMIFTAIFTVEITIKVICFGLILHKGSFVRSAFNLLDVLVVSVSIVSLASKDSSVAAIKILRICRVLRPLRAINRAKGLKRIVECMIVAVKTIGNIILVQLLLQFIFSIIGVQLFKGTFFYCTDKSVLTEELCHGDYVVYHLLNNPRDIHGPKIEQVQVESRFWSRRDFNYDNCLNAMLSLFTVSTFEGWPQLLINSIDSTKPDQGPIMNNRPPLAAFYMIYIIVVAFFMVNIFVGFVIVTFQREGEQDFKNCELDKNQRKCIDYVLKAKPVRRYIPSARWQFKIWKIVTSKPFEFTIFGLISLNTVTLAMKFYGQGPTYTEVLDVLNVFFTIAFTFEFIIKIAAFGVKNYFIDFWNVLDFVIVMGSYLDIIAQQFEDDAPAKKIDGKKKGFSIAFFRLFRVMRLVKLLSKGEGIRTLLWTFMKSIQALPYVGLLIIMLFFVYAVIGMQIFGRIRRSPHTQINRNNNFATFFQAALVLFRCATGEAWQEVMLACSNGPDVYCDPNAHVKCDKEPCTCGTDFSYFYFISFYAVTSFLIINLFIAVIIENFDYLTRDWSILGPHHLDEFIQLWSEYDPDASGKVKHMEVIHLLRKISPPLGFGKLCPHQTACKRLSGMNMILTKGGKVTFKGTLFALVRTSLNIKMVGCIDDCNEELRAVMRKIWKRIDPHLIDEVVPPPGGTEITVGKFYSTFLIQEFFRKFRKRRELKAKALSGEDKKVAITLQAGIRMMQHLGPELNRTISGDLEADESVDGEEIPMHRRTRHPLFGGGVGMLNGPLLSRPNQGLVPNNLLQVGNGMIPNNAADPTAFSRTLSSPGFPNKNISVIGGIRDDRVEQAGGRSEYSPLDMGGSMRNLQRDNYYDLLNADSYPPIPSSLNITTDESDMEPDTEHQFLKRSKFTKKERRKLRVGTGSGLFKKNKTPGLENGAVPRRFRPKHRGDGAEREINARSPVASPNQTPHLSSILKQTPTLAMSPPPKIQVDGASHHDSSDISSPVSPRLVAARAMHGGAITGDMITNTNGSLHNNVLRSNHPHFQDEYVDKMEESLLMGGHSSVNDETPYREINEFSDSEYQDPRNLMDNDSFSPETSGYSSHSHQTDTTGINHGEYSNNSVGGERPPFPLTLRRPPLMMTATTPLAESLNNRQQRQIVMGGSEHNIQHRNDRYNDDKFFSRLSRSSRDMENMVNGDNDVHDSTLNHGLEEQPLHSGGIMSNRVVKRTSLSSQTSSSQRQRMPLHNLHDQSNEHIVITKI